MGLKRRFYLRTILAIIVVTLAFTGFHTYYHLNIQAEGYSSTWGRYVELDEIGRIDVPLIGKLEDGLIYLSLDENHQGYYKQVDAIGTTMEEGTVDFKDYNRHKSKDVFLVDNHLFYLANKSIYRASFEAGKGFTSGEKLVDNIERFTVEKVNEEIVIQGYNEDNLLFYKLEGDQTTLVERIQNTWDPVKVYFRETEAGMIALLIHKRDYYHQDILIGNVQEGGLTNVKTIASINSLTGKKVRELLVGKLDGKMTISYIESLVSRGSESNTIHYKLVNTDTLDVFHENSLSDRQSDSAYSRIGSEMQAYVKDNQLHLLSSGVNKDNENTDYRDVFSIHVDGDGKVVQTEFIVTTLDHSELAQVIASEDGEYVIFKEAKAGGLRVRLNSNNAEFVASNDLMKEDYTKAFLDGLTVPVNALSYMVIKLFIFILFLTPPYLVIGFALRYKRIEETKVYVLTFIAIYSVVNLLAFKILYYTPDVVDYVPNIINQVPYLVALGINVISAFVVWMFYRDNRGYSPHIAAYVALFVLIDMYMNNLMFVPFNYVKVLIMN